MQPRYLDSQLRQDLARKMVFVEGPRQVGKTTLAQSLPGASQGHLSWDMTEHRSRILKRELPNLRLGAARIEVPCRAEWQRHRNSPSLRIFLCGHEQSPEHNLN
jgi:hypothetical protein